MLGTRESLLARKAKDTTVETPAGTFRLRALTLTAMLELNSELTAAKQVAEAEGVTVNEDALTLTHLLVDDCGNRLLQPDDWREIAELDLEIAAPLVSAAMKLMGRHPEQVGELEKNSEPTPDSELSLSSPENSGE